jgi:alanyl-tRNA synthetase
MVKVKTLFQLHDTHGFSLTDSLGECQRRGVYPDWCDFFAAARKAGWKFDKVCAVVSAAIADACWSQSLKQVLADIFSVSLNPLP